MLFGAKLGLEGALESTLGAQHASEVPLGAFWHLFLPQIRVPILLFFSASLPLFAASSLRVVVTLLLIFDVASVLRAFLASASRC